MADAIPDKLPEHYQKPPPFPPKTISVMKPGATACISPGALFIDPEWGGWLDPSTRILIEQAEPKRYLLAPVVNQCAFDDLKSSAQANHYLLVRRTDEGYHVDVEHSSCKWERADSMTGNGLDPVIKFGHMIFC
jgi:hypothetical protein